MFREFGYELDYLDSEFWTEEYNKRVKGPKSPPGPDPDGKDPFETLADK
jgi:hypothetical protein